MDIDDPCTNVSACRHSAVAGAAASHTGGRRDSGGGTGHERLRMKLDSHDLDAISARTLGHYDSNAEDYRDGTRDHDVSQNIDVLLRHIAGAPPFTILDFGCGPGRDLKVFAGLGHMALGLDGAARFAAMARAATGCEVWQQDFLALDLPAERFDGVFANAALFHVPSQELPRVLRQLHATLKPGGVLFSSNPHGHNEEGWNRDRYGAYHDLETWRNRMSAAGFIELDHYYRPAGRPRAAQPWLASVWRRPATRSSEKTVPGILIVTWPADCTSVASAGSNWRSRKRDTTT